LARLTALSGLNRKSAAIFLVEIHGKRILFDLGDGLEPGEHPDLSNIGKIDAVFISHAHTDHAGSLNRLGEVGNPIAFASERTFDFLPETHKPAHSRVIPECGHFEYEGLSFQSGRCGHAPGGLWFHLETEHGGFIYTGDISLESQGMVFDPLPSARTLLIDASYGDRDQSLNTQIKAIAQQAANGAVLCCPAAGRGTDMALAMAAHGYTVHTSQVIADEIMAATGQAFPVVKAETARPDQVIIATESNGEAGLSAELLARGGFRFIFSSHVPHGTPAHRLTEKGDAIWLPWNVHPRKRDILKLADACGAEKVIPAFVNVDHAPELCAALEKRLRKTTETEI